MHEGHPPTPISQKFQSENAARVQAGIFFGVVLVSLIFFLCLLPPSITRGGDSGELVSASYLLGIPHPSGYPMWTLLSRGWAVLPLGEIGGRYNLFSAVCGALACGFLALSQFLWSQNTPFPFRSRVVGALATGWLLAGAFLVASQFLLAEVYALGALWMALLLWMALRWHDREDWRDAFTLAFLAGSAPLVHLSTLYFLPALLVLSLWKKRFSPAQILALCFFFALGLAPAAYLPLRSSLFPPPPATDLAAHAYFPLDWGHPTSFSALKNHLSAAQYRRLLWENGALAQPLEKWPTRAAQFFTLVGFQYLWATPLLLWGAIAASKKRAIALVALGIFAFNLAVSLHYNVPDQTNFLFPALLILALWMGWGWTALSSASEKWRVRGVVPILLLATIGAQWAIFAFTTNGRNQTRAHDLAVLWAQTAQRETGKEGKTGFILLGSDDSIWAFWYAKYVLNAAPSVETPWGRRHNKRRERGLWPSDVARLSKHGPVFLTEWEPSLAQQFSFQMLDESGAIVRLSDQLARPNVRFARSSNAPTQILRAQIPLHPLWREGDSKIPHLLPGTLAAFEAQIVLDESWPRAVLHGGNHPQIQAGKIEILTTPADFEGDDDLKVVWTQTIPLLLESAAPAQSAIFRAPYSADIDAKTGEYELWARLKNEAKTTPWTRVGNVVYTNK